MKGNSGMGEENRFYTELLDVIRQKINHARWRAVLSVNRELIFLYWDIGQLIDYKLKEAGWGKAVIPKLSADIKGFSPEIKGFSPRNIARMVAFYREYPEADQAMSSDLTGDEILPQAVAKIEALIFQLPWGHNILLIEKIKRKEDRLFYIRRSIEQGWSRNTLAWMCESRLHLREGKGDSNVQTLLPPEQSDLVQQALKDPYIFDFLTLTEPYQERELELALLNHIEKFLLELGVGFAFVGRQYPLRVGDSEYFIDLLFYHFKLRRFVVIELKKGGFKPEYAGKLNFYCNVVDDVLRHPDDQPTIGLILCQDKNEFVAEYAFKGIDTPMGVSEYQLIKCLPEELQSSLPTIEEIEAELWQEVKLPLQLGELGRSRSVPLASQPVGAGAGIESGELTSETLTVQEKSVIQYLQSHDAMTVKVVGELLSVKDSRAREILKALTDRGLLRKQGTARSTYYVRV